MADQGNEKDIWAIAAKQRIAMLTMAEEGRLVSQPMASLVRPRNEQAAIFPRKWLRASGGHPHLFMPSISSPGPTVAPVR